MNAILQVCLFCWAFVAAFFLFFLIPFEALNPTLAALLVIPLGVLLLFWQGRYIYRLHYNEGFELAYFLVRHRGWGRLFLSLMGLGWLVWGISWLVAPQQTSRQLAKIAMPVAEIFVVLFWGTLIFAFGGFMLICCAQAVGYARIKSFKSAVGSFAVGLLWLAFVTLFGKLFLEVVNDVFRPLTPAAQWLALGLLALTLTAGGLGLGALSKLKNLLPAEELKGVPPEVSAEQKGYAAGNTPTKKAKAGRPRKNKNAEARTQ